MECSKPFGLNEDSSEMLEKCQTALEMESDKLKIK